ncbi:glycosyltransferase family 4 protein [Alkalilimnicola sp. S0819]|uniref:glycosyltransferase family 4 protein n=1 Tax=Alkalilimnicola sp. S0819 TaxID=2613922 RepID=UPI001261CB7E|nr:glycosyltransferase family 4 protein [Alkalilimnicola sp. S0819]KAB7628251.1 glycosyltransferase family 4 protein [Alkalilimnicola sp. S0819]MPQ15142.1 glycosyltransferase [Alkalilimnicola sp. S0819]
MKSKKLRVLVVSQYFWPEEMRVNDLVEGLVARGHEVTVLTGWPNYPDGRFFAEYRRKPQEFTRYAGARIVRVPMLARGARGYTLLLNYLSFFLSAALLAPFKLRGARFDSVFVYAVSPITVAIPAIVLGRIKKAPVLLWVLDLWPETLEAVGATRSRAVLKLVGRLVSWIYNRADYLLLQSRAFGDSVRHYCTRPVADERLVYFPSWAEDLFEAGAARPSALLDPCPDQFTIVFAGNMGESQDFPAILDAAERLQGRVPVRWVIVGDGRMHGWVKQEVERRRLTQVHLLGRHPVQEMPALYAAADALLVSLKTNRIFAKTIPGKLQSYLAAGRPVLAMIDGEAAEVVRASGGGFACAAGDGAALAEAAERMAALSGPEREQMGQRSRAYYRRHFARESLFDRLETLMQSATCRRG